MELHIGGRWLAGTLLALGLAACGGGGGGSSPSPDGGPGGVPKGIEGTGKVVSHGSITAFGSIFVNGVEYSTDKAAIQVDGRSVSESELKLGQVVTVVGTLNEADRTKAVADTVTFTAPTFYRAMALAMRKEPARFVTSSLRASVSAGEALPDATRTL